MWAPPAWPGIASSTPSRPSTWRHLRSRLSREPTDIDVAMGWLRDASLPEFFDPARGWICTARESLAFPTGAAPHWEGFRLRNVTSGTDNRHGNPRLPVILRKRWPG